MWESQVFVNKLYYVPLRKYKTCFLELGEPASSQKPSRAVLCLALVRLRLNH